MALEISEILKISNSDIKDFLVTEKYLLACGRDGNLHLRIGDASTSFVPNEKNINSIAFDGKVAFLGTQSGEIAAYEVETGSSYFLKDHTDNVCSLDALENLLVSGSWDKSCRIWDLADKSTLHLLPHLEAVWSVKFISRRRVLTGSADRLIRIYEEGKISHKIDLHCHVVRGAISHSDFFYSVDNQGTVLKISQKGDLLNHLALKNMFYSITGKDKDIVVSGEDGRVAVLDEDLNIKEDISIPLGSVWKSAFFDGKLYSAGSDGCIYIYAHKGDKKLMEELSKKENKEEVGDREFVSGGKKFKVVGGNVFQEEGGEWILIGEASPSKSYDNSFQVELDNKYYTLSFDNDENVYEVADKFLREHKLREEFRDDIVEFIKKNFKPKSSYIVYEGINVEGIKKHLPNAEEYSVIFDNINRQSTTNGGQSTTTGDKSTTTTGDKSTTTGDIKEILDDILKGKFRFIGLDLLRYFIVQKYSFNLSFLFTIPISNKKEAVSFVRLLTVLYADPPFNVECLRFRILKFKDEGFLQEGDLEDYYYNRNLYASNLRHD